MSAVIYLTGSPATGKSTLSRNLKKAYRDLLVFSYSEELRKHVARRAESTAISEDQIREQSSKLVTAEDVKTLDAELVELVRKQRSHRPILIDSHAVTKEAFGFRVTGFAVPALQDLAPDVIVCLYASSQVIRERIGSNAMGRPQVSEFEADLHTHAQIALAIQYGTLLGKPVYLLDGAVKEEDLVATVAKKAKLAAG